MDKSSELAGMANFECDRVFNSPIGRMFTLPETEQVLCCALGLLHPVDVAALKAELSATVVTCHPRFSSLLVDDPRPSSQTQYWRKTEVNIDDHVVVVNTVNGGGDDEASVNAYLADLAVSSPLSRDKPLWEVHVLVGLNCVVFRMHHAVGDGNSLMSLLVACFGGEKTAVVEEKRRSWREGGLWGMMKSVWYTAVYQAVMIGRIMGVRDEKTVISGGEGVELWPRTVSTAKFKIDDMKEVKKAIPNAVRDRILGAILGMAGNLPGEPLNVLAGNPSPEDLGLSLADRLAASSSRQAPILLPSFDDASDDEFEGDSFKLPPSLKIWIRRSWQRAVIHYKKNAKIIPLKLVAK